jgi:hypothetical protein
MANRSWKDAVLTVLGDAKEALHYTDIADAIVERRLRDDVGATPAATVSSTVTLSIQKDGDNSPFMRVGKGYVALKPPKGKSPPPPPDTPEDEAGLINAFGMYWRRDKVLWTSSPKLLGQQQPGATTVDFSAERGVYLLHDGRSVVYVGRTTDQALGKRLQQHTVDRLNGRWDRFSWFGVFPVKEDGTLNCNPASAQTIDLLIITMEALLIEGLEPPQNRKRGDDFRAVEFLQVEDPEIGKNQILQLMDQLKKKL